MQGIELEDQRKKILKELEEQQLVCSQEADDYSKKNKEISKILDQLRAGTLEVTDLNEPEVLFALSLLLEAIQTKRLSLFKVSIPCSTRLTVTGLQLMTCLVLSQV